MHTRHDDPGTATTRLRADHDLILRALAVLERFGRCLERGEPVDRGALERLSDFFTTFVDRCHHGKEEQHLFPALVRHGLPRDGGPVGVMLLEHEEGRGLLRAMRQQEDRKTAVAIRQYARLLRAHIDKENGILFPLAEQIIPGEEDQLLIRAFDALEEALAGSGIRERLVSELARLEGDCERRIH